MKNQQTYSRAICFYLSERGKEVALRCKSFLLAFFEDCKVSHFSKEALSSFWDEADLLVFVMALGITVRSIASLLRGKGEDPGVIVIDETSKFVLPLIGGHARRANQLAKDLALYLEAQPVITTAGDLLQVPPLDNLLEDLGLKVKNKEALAKVMAKLNSEGRLSVYLDDDLRLSLPPAFIEVKDPSLADLIISYRLLKGEDRLLSEGRVKALPPVLWIGVGFHEVLSEADFERTIDELLPQHGFDPGAVEGLATLDRKSSYLPLKNFCLRRGFKLFRFSAEDLASVETVSVSKIALAKVGSSSVAEAASLLASKGKLLLPKVKGEHFTLAVSAREFCVPGKLFVVGLGPGDLKYLTLRALQALSLAQAVVGYESYLKLIEPLLDGKEVYAFRMTQEVERAKKAVELSSSGKLVALVSGGDPTIYGMAGLLLEILAKTQIAIEVEIIPGVSALNAASARCGAPLANDFAVISLSDRLTPLEVIEQRLRYFAKANVPIVIYNPRSRGRVKPLRRALEILLEERGQGLPVAILNNIARPNEEVLFTKLENIDQDQLGMNSTLIVGSSETEIMNLWMITRRGYEKKYEV